MKKLIYIWGLLFLCVSCERDLMSYEGEEAVYFAVQYGESWGTEKDWPYMPYTTAEFGRILEDTMVVRIKVAVTGPEKDYPRPFKIVVNPDSTTAREGIDYRMLADEYIVESNSSFAYVPVLLYRQPEMKTDTVTLGLKLVPNDFFAVTFKRFDKMDGFTNGKVVIDSFDATLHSIFIVDVMPQPSQWSKWEFGTFTETKLNRMCKELGYTYADFEDKMVITYLQQAVISRQFSKILNEAYHKKEPILEDNGQLMWVNGCEWEEGTYPDKDAE